MSTRPIQFSKFSWLWYVISTALLVPGIIAICIAFASNSFNVGIDFKGGAILQESYSEARPAIEEIRTSIDAAGVPGATVQTTGENGIFVRFAAESGRNPQDDASTLSSALAELGALDSSKRSFETVGASVASTTTRNAAIAVVLTALAITLYVAWSFRGVPKPASSWRFGATTIIALVHDLVFVIGAFALLGWFIPTLEIDALFITALLTVMGFSVNDTIVVFDRLRENLQRHPGREFSENADSSLSETMARSLNTSGTILIVLIALLVLGGESIRSFTLALTLGVAVGTYSSIFTATPLLVTWQQFAKKQVQKAK
jgi:preprotein translocase subunit SecF